jgi:hypothetical protein
MAQAERSGMRPKLWESLRLSRTRPVADQSSRWATAPNNKTLHSSASLDVRTSVMPSATESEVQMPVAQDDVTRVEQAFGAADPIPDEGAAASAG